MKQLESGLHKKNQRYGLDSKDLWRVRFVPNLLVTAEAKTNADRRSKARLYAGLNPLFLEVGAWGFLDLIGRHRGVKAGKSCEVKRDGKDTWRG